MDQIRIGRFIAIMRKDKKMTQSQLAEIIGISDKTVSKWETGRGLPDVSLMMPLCEALNITVNELLSGERLNETEYKKKAEENIMELMKEKRESKVKIALSIVGFLVTFVPGITLILLSGTMDMEIWKRVILAVGGITIFGGILIVSMFDWTAGTYECSHCGKRFRPTFFRYIFAPHTITKRRMKCPHCGEKSYCSRRLTH